MRSNPSLRRSKQPPVNFDESGLLQEQFQDPSFFQPMNEEPILTRRLSQRHLSQRPKPPKGESTRHGLKKQPSTRPSLRPSTNRDSARELLPMQEFPAEPQWQGKNKRQISPAPYSGRQRQSISPPPAAVVTPPESHDKKKHRHSTHHKSKSSSKPKSRRSNRHSTSKERRSSHDRLEVKDVEQRHMHPAVQEHILAELQMAQKIQKEQEVYHSHRRQSPKQRSKKKSEKQNRHSKVDKGPEPEILHPYLQEHILAERDIKESAQQKEQQQREQALLDNARQQDPNGMHEYLQEHFLAMADRDAKPFPAANNYVDDQFASFAGNLLDAHQANPMLGENQNQDHQRLREERQRRHREKKRNRKKGWFGRKSNHSRTRSSPDTSVSSADSGFAPPPAPRAQSSTPPPPSTAENTPKSIGFRLKSVVLPSRRKKRENNQSQNDHNLDAPNTIADPLLQQSILESISAMNANPQQMVPRAPPRSQSDLQHRSSKRGEEPRLSRRRRHSQSNIPDLKQRQDEQQDVLDSNMERLEIGMVSKANGRKDVDNFILDQGVALDSLQQEPHQQKTRRQQQLDPKMELKEIAMMFASNTGEFATIESNDVGQQPNQSDAKARQFLLEQQTALEALQRQQRKRESKVPAPAPVPASNPSPQSFVHAPSNLKKPPPEQRAQSTPHLALNQMGRCENPSSGRPTLKDPPTTAALPVTPVDKQVDYCGNSWDGSRSTLWDEEEDFFDWGSVDDGPPVREIVTRDSVVSAITNPIREDGEFYSESEPEDYYAENYDSDDYVDEDEWERLEKALKKGGPEAARQWEEFLLKQSQMAEGGPSKNETMGVKEQSRPYDGGYAPSPMVDYDEEAPSPQVAKAPPPPLQSVRTTFVCECCAEHRSIKDQSLSCENFDTPHMVCTTCMKNYLETKSAKFRMTESKNKTLYQVKCFTCLDVGKLARPPKESIAYDG
ncbi:MAG: hypothetical protein SGBAC_009256 [Bacillariaceae sp.]